MSERTRISGEGGRRIEGIGAGQMVVKQVRVGVQIEKVCVAVIERVITLVMDLRARTVTVSTVVEERKAAIAAGEL